MLRDARTDDGQKVITIAHPEHSSGELNIKPIKYHLVQILLGTLRVYNL